jgi:hypothetical protein
MKTGLSILVATCSFLTFVASVNAMLLEGFESDTVGNSPAGANILAGNGATVQTGAGFGNQVSATEGNQFAYLTTGPGDLGLIDPGDYQITVVDTDWAFMGYSFDGNAGNVLSFDINILTSEYIEGAPDVVHIQLDSDILLSAVIDTMGDYPVVDGFPVISGFYGGTISGPDSSSFWDGQIGWSQISTTLSTSGSHFLGFYVADLFDANLDTALLVDNIQLTSDIAPVPEPATLILFGSGIAGIVGARYRRKK